MFTNTISSINNCVDICIEISTFIQRRTEHYCGLTEELKHLRRGEPSSLPVDRLVGGVLTYTRAAATATMT